MTPEVEALIARIRALSDVAYWANVEWVIPGDATQAIGKLAVEAADALAALTAEVADLHQADRIKTREINVLVPENRELLDRAEKAEAERDANAKDAERLDWLSANPREATIRVGTEIKACVFYGVSCDPKWSAREAIDAALKDKP